MRHLIWAFLTLILVKKPFLLKLFLKININKIWEWRVRQKLSSFNPHIDEFEGENALKMSEIPSSWDSHVNIVNLITNKQRFFSKQSSVLYGKYVLLFADVYIILWTIHINIFGSSYYVKRCLLACASLYIWLVACPFNYSESGPRYLFSKLMGLRAEKVGNRWSIFLLFHIVEWAKSLCSIKWGNTSVCLCWKHLWQKMLIIFYVHIKTLTRLFWTSYIISLISWLSGLEGAIILYLLIPPPNLRLEPRYIFCKLGFDSHV